MSQLQEARRAKALHRSAILSRANVVGLGVGYKVSGSRVTDELSVVVLVRRKMPLASLPPEAIIPREVESVRTDVLQIGEIRPLQARTDRWRPAPAGVSLGHYHITAGTFGCVVLDRASGARLMLSNNHVLANSNQAALGDPILQPGPLDGGQLGQDIIARLERFQPIRFNTAPATCNLAKSYAWLGNWLARQLGSRHQLQALQTNPALTNLVDAAVARPLEDSAILDESLEIGQVSGVSAPHLGMLVRKSGRTTAFTSGAISVLDATVVIDYGAQFAATFENQIITTPMSLGGDSGSLLVANNAPQAVGLLFAGSDQATIHNPIQAVLESLNVSLPSAPAQALTGRQAAVEKAQAVRQAYQDRLMSKANVVRVGVGLLHKRGKRSDEIGLVVIVRRKLPKSLLAPEDILPERIEGVAIDVKEA
ncbi:MAG: hypothetical protein JXA78_08860 [Anaerolineales bacterium]|nr:hypothetical protein [Anaerolineales bacterium]